MDHDDGRIPAALVGVAKLDAPPAYERRLVHRHGLLEGPHYSRPELLVTPDGLLPVPPVLLSGHHAEIARWRRDQSLALTARRRPDLIAAARAAGLLSARDEQTLKSLGLQ
jgi:tRNA (guanine37-N1)-methyltransferase